MLSLPGTSRCFLGKESEGGFQNWTFQSMVAIGKVSEECRRRKSGK